MTPIGSCGIIPTCRTSSTASSKYIFLCICIPLRAFKNELKVGEHCSCWFFCVFILMAGGSFELAWSRHGVPWLVIRQLTRFYILYRLCWINCNLVPCIGRHIPVHISLWIIYDSHCVAMFILHRCGLRDLVSHFAFRIPEFHPKSQRKDRLHRMCSESNLAGVVDTSIVCSKLAVRLRLVSVTIYVPYGTSPSSPASQLMLFSPI